MRPIDADALKETIDNIWDGRPISLLGARILATIDHAPTIDAVEVVRCKDCKQRRVEGDCTNYYYCDFLGSICGDNEYCSFGERREP